MLMESELERFTFGERLLFRKTKLLKKYRKSFRKMEKASNNNILKTEVCS